MSRLIPIAGVVLAAAIGFLYWKLSQSGDEVERTHNTKVVDAKAAIPKPIEPRPAARPVAEKALVEQSKEMGASEPKAELLDEDSKEFQYRVEVDIPDKLRAAGAAACDLDLTSDNKVHFSYRLHVVGGTVSVDQVKVTKSEVNDVTELCLRNAIESATWTVDDMADFEEENDLFIRLRTMRKYKTRAEFKRGE